MGKYKIIYADPPWSYNDKMKGHSFSLDHEYVTQDKDWIQQLPVSNISDKDCVLFIWAVSPLLDEAFEVISAWGFKYKTVAFCWVKTYKDNTPVSNLGRWTMGGIELCLLATKGHPKRICNNIKQVVMNGRGKHSRKPPEVRERIVKLMGDLPRIELFARERGELFNEYDGWDVWGDEINSTIKLEPTVCEQS